MFSNERDRVDYFNNVVTQGTNMARQLTWDPVTKRIRPVGFHEANPSGLLITPSDMKHSRV